MDEPTLPDLDVTLSVHQARPELEHAMSEPTTRLDEIDRWWGDDLGGPGVWTLTQEEQDRLRGAFTTVLGRLPVDDFEVFMRREPALVCVRDARGTAMTFRRDVPSEPCSWTHTELYVIYLNPDVLADRDEALADTVAHETAHVVLGHDGVREQPRSVQEAAADEQAVRWGFARRYSPEMIEDLQRQDRGVS
jgi:hypothetical protein